jgi:hypothetical protein
VTSRFSPCFWLTEQSHLLAKTRHTAGTRPLRHRQSPIYLAWISRAAFFLKVKFLGISARRCMPRLTRRGPRNRYRDDAPIVLCG